jgi:GntR family transcriptional regulator
MLLTIDENDNRPIYLQIIAQIREQVGNGTLKVGDVLPSVREVADSLNINMHTVRSAYLKLRDQGIISMHLGRRAKIAPIQLQPDLTNVEADIKTRLKELMTDAILQGINPEELAILVNQLLEQLKEEYQSEQGESNEK